MEAACGSRGCCEPRSPSSSSSRHGQIANASGLGHGICQNVMIVALRQPLADHLAAAARSGSPARARSGSGVWPRCPPRRELRVDAPILVPIGAPKGRAHVRDVAQRPQPLVREAASSSRSSSSGREPHAPQLVRRRRSGGTAHAIVRVDGLAVGRSAAVGDPCARARAHDRLERRDEAARGALHADPLRRGHVDVRLAIRHHDDVVPAQLAVQRFAQRLLRPRELAVVAWRGSA